VRLPSVIFIVTSLGSIVALPAQAQNRGSRNSFGSSLFGGVISDGLRGGASLIGGLFTGHSRGGGSSGSQRRGSNNEFRGRFPQTGDQGPGPGYNPGYSPRLFPSGGPTFRPRFQGGYGAPAMYPVGYSAGYGSPSYNFDYAQPYAYPPQYPSAPEYSYASQARYAPQYPLATQYSSAPLSGYAPVYDQAHDQPHDQPRYAAPSRSEPYSNVPDFYMIAFNDGSIQAALAYSVDGDTLRWTARNHVERRAPIAAVDRSFSEQLNRDRRVEFRLP